ncbi:MAG: AmpD protein [Oceanicoccus sp.]|jgi:AmpD protein
MLSEHWLPDTRQLVSPNFNFRPENCVIDLLVIHNISLPAGVFGSACIEQLFTNCLDCDSHMDFDDLRGLQVSSHLLIDRQGVVSQFVPLNFRAWHAGESAFEGKPNCNDYSIGIEMEGTDDCPYTERQYQSLFKLTQQIICAYPAINPQRICGHSDIAPGRKTDPGAAFDWDYYLNHIE